MVQVQPVASHCCPRCRPIVDNGSPCIPQPWMTMDYKKQWGLRYNFLPTLSGLASHRKSTMSGPKNDTSAKACLPPFQEEPLCVYHESSSALRSINVSTFLDDYITDLDDALAAAQKMSDLLRLPRISARVLSSSPST